MSVQTELTRISTAKTNIKNVVNNNTANTITNQKLDAFPPLINGTIAAQKGYIPWIKGEGKHLTLKNSKSGELDRFEMYGNTEQNQYNGKNLFNIDAVTGVANGSINANKIIVTNAGTSTNYNVAPTFSTKTLYSGKTYYLSADIRRVSGEGTFGKMNDYVADWTAVTTPTLSTSYQRYTYKKTFSSDTNYYRILIQFRNTNNGIFEIKNIQISEVDNIYEPYCGGVAAPNPDYPQEVKVVENEQNINVRRKNLFDKSRIIVGERIDPQGEPYTDTNCSLSDYINVKPNTTYTRNLIPSVYQCIAFYTSDKTFISRSTNYATNITPSNAYYVRISMENANVDTVQLEQGSTATTYEPYQNQDYEIDLKSKNIYDGLVTKGSYNTTTGKVDTTIYNMWRNADTIKVEPNKDYIFSLSGVALNVTIRVFYYDINKTFISSETTSNGKFTTPNNCYYLNWHSTMLYTNYPNGLTNAMIEENTTATEYEPYYDYELCKVRDYKDEIKKSTGKNLFKPFNYTRTNYGINFTYNEDGSININGTSTGNALSMFSNEASPYLITLQPGTYTISGDITDIRLNVVDSSGALISVTNTNRTFTINETTSAFIRANISSGKTFNNVKIYPQLEENDQVTEFEPYGTNWHIKKNINKVVLDGSESWPTASSTDGNRFVCTTYNNAMIPSSTKNIGGLKSDKFIAISADDTANAVNGIAIAGSGRFTIYYANAKNYTSTEFKTWLSNNPITVYYILATPTYEIITNEILINQLNAIETFEGINNISIENENNVLPDILMITKNKDSYNNWKTKKGLN